MAITETQSRILHGAVERPDGTAVPPSGLPPAPRAAVAKALLGAGLLEAGPRGEPNPTLVWRIDGEAMTLRITDAGRAAIGLDQAVAARGEGGEIGEPQPASLATAGSAGPTAADPAIDAAQGAPQAVHPPGSGARLREAAQAFLTAWDKAAGERSGPLLNAVECLRARLARGGRPRPNAARRPRENTKQAQVLALLRREEGASGPAIAEATGWAPHTVRGFLAGLTRKGMSITVLERVRQVGPNSPGAKGSYTVYRIGETL